MPDNYLPDVRSQYEALPYPARNPQDDHQRLVRTWLEDLPMVNHYGFAGKQSFGHRFRALVAGGGTGDATIFLAEQLRHTDAQIVHLDMSQAAMTIARERARIRGLANIRWVHDSLLNLPALGLSTPLGVRGFWIGAIIGMLIASASILIYFLVVSAPTHSRVQADPVALR